jgi:hypothetical protein
MDGSEGDPRGGAPAGHAGDTPAENFRRIPGVGRAIESKLHQAGIRTYAALAEQPADELAALTGVPAHKTREWADQARALAAEAPRPDPEAPRPDPAEKPEPSEDRQHYESFTLRLLLNEDHQVRRLHAAHVQSGRERAWPAWATAELLDFVVEQAGLQEPVQVPVVAAQAAQPAGMAHTAGSTGTVRLKELEIVPAASEQPGMMVTAGEPFAVRIGLDLGGVDGSERTLEYNATFSAKPLGGGPRQVLGELSGKAVAGEATTLAVRSPGLLAGTYQLEVVVGAGAVGAARPDLLAAHLQGSLLHVS